MTAAEVESKCRRLCANIGVDPDEVYGVEVPVYAWDLPWMVESTRIEIRKQWKRFAHWFETEAEIEKGKI